LNELLAPSGTEGLTDPNDVPAPPDQPVTQLGDLWVLDLPGPKENSEDEEEVEHLPSMAANPEKPVEADVWFESGLKDQVT
jgi:hypothetical protein